MHETIARTDRINALVNDPSIRPFVGPGDDVLDLSEAVAHERNVFLVGEHGGFAFSWCAPQTYEVHTFVLPEGRGDWAASFAMSARNCMRDYGATHLWTRVPVGAENVRKFTLKAGFQPAGRDSVDYGNDVVEYDLYDWRPQCL
jgi:hypothetical protein